MNTINTFLLDLGERAVKSAAQGALTALGFDALGSAVSNPVVLHLNATGVNWAVVGGFAAGGAVLSILTSLASAPVKSNGTASLVSSIISAPTFGIDQKAETTMAPIAADGSTEYTTYEGIPNQAETPAPASDPASVKSPEPPSTPAVPFVPASEIAAEPAPSETTVQSTPLAPAEPAPTETPAAADAPQETTVTEPVQENADGSVTINGVVYHPATA